VNQKSTGSMRTRREVVRRRRHERQILVFGLAAILLATVSFAGYSVYTGEAEGPFSEPFVTPAGEFVSDIRLPCPPNDTLPMNAGEVPVRVLNSTDRAGLAGSVLSTLEGRGFYALGATNASRTYEDVARITFGVNGLVQAYTVARHFDEAELVLDTRDNGTVDITLGDGFEPESIRALLAPELDADTILSPRAQCLPADLVPAEPAPRSVPDDPFAPDPSASPSPSPDEDEPEVVIDDDAIID